MNARARAAALLRVWTVVGLAGPPSTLSFAAVLGSRAGCIETKAADVVPIAGTVTSLANDRAVCGL